MVEVTLGVGDLVEISQLDTTISTRLFVQKKKTIGHYGDVVQLAQLHLMGSVPVLGP